MKFQSRSSVNIAIRLIKVIAVFIVGSLGMHLLVMLIDYYLMIKPFYLNLHANFAETIFSTPMYPMMGAYGLYSLGIYFLWERKKKAIHSSFTAARRMRQTRWKNTCQNATKGST